MSMRSTMVSWPNYPFYSSAKNSVIKKELCVVVKNTFQSQFKIVEGVFISFV